VVERSSTVKSLASQLDRLATDRWAWRSVRRVLRACWLGICLACIWLGGSLVWGWPVQLEWLAAVALACIGIALLSLLQPRMRPREAARRLDRRFDLDEQLATAVEVAASNPQPGTVAAQLVQHATRTSRGLRQRIRRHQRMPWVELLTLLAMLLVAIGLLVLSGIGVPGFGGQTAPLPPLPRVADPADLFPEEPAPPGEGQEGMGGEPMPGAGEEMMPAPGSQTGMGQQNGEPGQQGAQTGTQSGEQTGGGDPRTMQALADALRDQGATRPAADALDRGDAAGAAQELRELADLADQLSSASRSDLADNLREAARNIERTDPQMADQMRESANDIEGNGGQAARGLEELAAQLDQMANGQQGSASEQPGAQQGQGQQPGQGEGQGQGQPAQGEGQGQGTGAGNNSAGQQRPVQPERLGVDGRPVELEAEGGGQQAAAPVQPGTTVPGGGGGTAGGDPRNMGAAGPDPLRIPLDERDVVQEYFNP
jgi:hypothetical protein